MSPSSSPVPQTPGDGRLVAVDLLRGAAALAVVATHLPRTPPPGLGARFVATLPLDFGVLGVPMFIVLSGFCIHLGFARRLASGNTAGWSWSAFWKRRFVRLYPTYLVAVAFSLAVMYGLTPAEERPKDLPADVAGDVVTHLAMIHNLTHYYHGGLGNPPFWTLGLEEQLYGLFAVVVLLRTRVRTMTLLGIGFAVSLLWQIGRVWVPFLLSRYAGTPPDAPLPLGVVTLGYWEGWPFGWWFLWLIGAAAAEAHVGLIRVPAWLTSTRLILVTLAISSAIHWRTLGRYSRFWLTDPSQQWLKAWLNTVVGCSELVFAIACFALLLRLIRHERAGGLTSRVPRALAAVGLFSYSLYLTHLPLLWLMRSTLGTPGDAAGILWAMAIGVPACVAFAAAFFVVFERPFLRKRRTPATEAVSVAAGRRN